MSKFSSEAESANIQTPESAVAASETLFSPAEIHALTELIELRAKSFARDYAKSNKNVVSDVSRGQDAAGTTSNLLQAYQELVSEIAAVAKYEMSEEEIVKLTQMRNLSFSSILEVVSDYIVAEKNKPVYSITFTQQDELKRYISEVSQNFESGMKMYLKGPDSNFPDDMVAREALYTQQIMITILFEICRVADYPRSGKIVRAWLAETEVGLDSILEFAMEKMNIVVEPEIQSYIKEVKAKSEVLVENMIENAASGKNPLSKEDAEKKTRQLQLLAIAGDIMSRLVQQGYASAKSYDELVKFVESEDLDFENVFEETVRFLRDGEVEDEDLS